LQIRQLWGGGGWGLGGEGGGGGSVQPPVGKKVATGVRTDLLNVTVADLCREADGDASCWL